MARRIAFCCKLRSEPSGGRGALMANVLVTGGAGYVGSVCCAELLRLGHSVTVVDDLSAGFRDGVPRGAAFIPMDIGDRKSTRLNSSHGYISYAVFCLKKKKKNYTLSLLRGLQRSAVSRSW